ncbi:hypothetical protein [Streptomyces sp. SID14515]|uniref:hypothetical protein n=1 Tax=Streptomyces sp. SID14515 TaxID=2706074 RepID=UPI0013C92252|nr:hypothetical protein [Streptomyces sp. SID14515]NEB36712.1 hypothetical protein [Streptomyces sp. SID14515]
MKRLLVHGVTPVLLLLQVAYVGFFGVLFAVSGPGAAAIDHTDPSPVGDALFTGLLLVVVLLAAGGAALLGRESLRARVPGGVRTGWLGTLAVAEVVMAATFAIMALQESLGPDSLVAAVSVTVCAGIALACAGEVRSGIRTMRRPAQPHV